MFRAALVALKPGSGNVRFIEHATALANRHSWSLTGISVVDPAQVAPSEAVPMGGMAYKTHRDQVLLEKAREGAHEALRALAHSCQLNQVPCGIMQLEGDLRATLAQAAVERDVILLGHHTRPEVDDLQRVSSFHDILRHASRPAIVIPHAIRDQLDEKQVVIAFDGSFQASRALQIFESSGLATGCNVHVVSFDSTTEEADATAARGIAFLRNHDISAAAHANIKSGDVGESILEACRNLHAGMLVMGAYGQRFVREFFLGSATKSVLKHAELQLLITH